MIVNLPKRSTGTDANVPMRGVEPAAFAVRDEVKIVEGRPFALGPQRSDRRPLGAARSSPDSTSARSSSSGRTTGRSWASSRPKGSISESEIWADAAVLAPAYRRGISYQNAVVKLASPGSFQAFKDALTSDPRVNLKIVRETEYYAEQSQTLVRIVNFLAGIITTLMGLGAIFGALNTMYTAVAARAREIATLEAIGFRGAPIVISVLVESIVLALLGGVIGAVGAWLAFDGFRAATMNWQTFSQVAFAFDVNAPLLIAAIVSAVVIGLIGGLFPAIRAARLPVAVALRER